MRSVVGLNDGTMFINVLRNWSSLSSSSKEVTWIEDSDGLLGSGSIAEHAEECSFLSSATLDAEELTLSIGSSSEQRRRQICQTKIRYGGETLTIAVHRVVIVHVKDIQRYRTIAWFCRSSSSLRLFDRIGTTVIFIERAIVETRTDSTFVRLRCGVRGSSFRWHNSYSNGEKREGTYRSDEVWGQVEIGRSVKARRDRTKCEDKSRSDEAWRHVEIGRSAKTSRDRTKRRSIVRRCRRTKEKREISECTEIW